MALIGFLPRSAHAVKFPLSPTFLHLTKILPLLLASLGILSTCALAALQPPPDPYLGDIETNYTYERACHHYAVDQSSRIYESGSVRFRMLDVYYHKCLSTIWPECEVVKTTEQFPRFDSHIAFKRNDIIAVRQSSNAHQDSSQARILRPRPVGTRTLLHHLLEST